MGNGCAMPSTFRYTSWRVPTLVWPVWTNYLNLGDFLQLVEIFLGPNRLFLCRFEKWQHISNFLWQMIWKLLNLKFRKLLTQYTILHPNILVVRLTSKPQHCDDMAVVLAQLAERSLQIPKGQCSNPVIGNF